MTLFFKTLPLTVLLWLITIIAAPAQEYLFDTEVINVEDGLPHRMVYGIVQDKEGFIWVNTQGAISRYDGYNFKTYNASFLNVTENSKIAMAIDVGNRLWYCEMGFGFRMSGVIDIAKDSIYSMDVISKGLFTAKDVAYVANSKVNSNEVIIVTQAGIIYKFNGDLEEIHRLSSSPSPDLMCEASDGGYWISDFNKLIHIKDGKSLKKVNTGKRIVYIDNTWPEPLIRVSPENMLWTVNNDTLVPYTITPHIREKITGVLRLHKDYSCYTTNNALLVRDTKGKLIYHFQYSNSSKNSRGLVVRDILAGRQNMVWVATDDGLLKLTTKKNPFEILLPGYNTRGIFKDDKTLWVGGSRYMGTIPENIKPDQDYLNARSNRAMSFYKDLQGHLWVGTLLDKKILEYLPDKDTFITYHFNSRRSFHLIFQNSVTKNYWIGTSDGLMRLDKETKRTTPFSLPVASGSMIIQQFYQNEEGVWIVSSKGIFLMDAERETIIQHYTAANGLPTNSIYYIHEDSNGIFWLGTKDAGLIRWDRTTNSFSQYSREDELSNNKIYAVYEDDFETLWLPSDYGLMAFDKKTETSRVYLPKDGIAHEEFNYFSHFEDKDGTLYFGGLEGITKFNPSTLLTDKIEIPLYATQVRILERNAENYTDKTNAFKIAKKIVLNPNDRILEVELTLLDYEKSEKNQYAYKLSGTQEQWIYTRENKISVISPPYGRYDLVIKARGASGTWSEKLLSIPMHVKLPFYRQWWFILASVLMSVTLIIISVRWRVRKLEKDRQRLEAEVKKRTRKIEQDKITIETQAGELKALDKAKTRFFANITHEFRTPLTLVTGPLEQILSKKPPASFRKELSNVLKNAHSLLGLINQLLDMSKLEGGRMQLEVAHGDIVRYTGKLVARFQPLADKKKIHLDFTAHANAWKTHFDSDKWTKILYNLLSNALKFTPEGGRITVHLEQVQQSQQEGMQLTVKDTGIGIEAGQLKHIFDRFYQVDASATRTAGGTGIGLALVRELAELQSGSVSVSSAPGEGATFTVTLPVLPAPADTKEIPLPEVPEIGFPFTDEAETTVDNEREAIKNKDVSEKIELLIVEDHPGMRAYIRSCIDTSVYNITEAADGQEGIAKALEIVPDLIISDVMMPKKNGFELARAIRDHIATSHIPLILLTAKASLESRLKGLERGVDAYLTKPFSPEELALRIQKLIELRRSLRERYQNDTPPEAVPEFEKEDAFISNIKDYINKDIGNPDLNVAHICDHFAMSSRQLYRKLKALKNTTVAGFIRAVRMEKAMGLLKENKLSISEIAYTTGFSSLSHFSRVFKKVHGKAPSQFQ